MKTILSVDFDFFIRENPSWDYGHSEEDSIFLNTAWIARYMSVDLYAETDIKKYADFQPVDMFMKLIWLGFNFKNTKLVVADSHKHAYDVLGKKSKVINFDAHHDLWKEKKDKVDCGNWLYKGIQNGLVGELFWVAPTWSREFNGKEKYWFQKGQYKEIKGYYFDQLKENQFKKTQIDTLFICRSGAWVPPHHDAEFVRMVTLFRNLLDDIRLVEELKQRKFPTREMNKKMVKQMKEGMAKLDMLKGSVPVAEV